MSVRHFLPWPHTSIRPAEDNQVAMTYQGVAEVLGRGSVSVCSLDNTDLDAVNTGSLDKVDNEHGSKTGNLVTIQQLEGAIY